MYLTYLDPFLFEYSVWIKLQLFRSESVARLTEGGTGSTISVTWLLLSTIIHMTSPCIYFGLLLFWIIWIRVKCCRLTTISTLPFIYSWLCVFQHSFISTHRKFNNFLIYILILDWPLFHGDITITFKSNFNFSIESFNILLSWNKITNTIVLQRYL